ncbi:MAG: ATP phosphoribosyltransferase regulatory subunit [Leptospiraceae bacterium]|nr:ATP phosphoribosyltransferase regulatory subunit [Leptospiraceae bacterium]
MNKIFRTRRSPSGFSFLDVSQTEKLQNIARLSQQIIVEEGYQRVMPPSFDYPETFSESRSAGTFHVRDHLGEDLAIRNDMTVQVIKGFANQLDLAPDQTSFKYFYTAPVFHDILKSYPSAREIYQLGVEVIGVESKNIIPDLLNLATRVLQKITRNKIRIIISDVQIARAIAALSPETEHAECNRAILNRDAVSLGNILGQQKSLQPHSLNLARALLFKGSESNVVLQKLRNLGLPRSIIDMIENLVAFSANLSVGAASVEWEPLLLRKSDYYTGYIFEFYIEGLNLPALRGGSYDNLVAKYSQNNLPASGFALDLSSLLKII